MSDMTMETPLGVDQAIAGSSDQAGPPIAKEFRIGLALANGISVDAYTAGMLDVLVEAREAWEAVPGQDGVPDDWTGREVIAGHQPIRNRWTWPESASNAKRGFGPDFGCSEVRSPVTCASTLH